MERRSLIFISGKITGLNHYYAFQKFKAAEKRLTQLGYEVKNPMRLCKPHWSWLRCMAVCLWNLIRCPEVYFLDNYTYSRGARIEYRVALFMKKTIIIQRR